MSWPTSGRNFSTEKSLMPTRFTRHTVRISSKDGFANAADADDLFALEPNEVPGNLPPEQPDEESVTIRVIKTPTGSEMLIRFSQGNDAHTVHSIEGLSPKDLVDEATNAIHSMLKGLLTPPDRYQEIAPGIYRGITTGRKHGKVSASDDINRRTRECIAALILAGLPEREITASKVANIEFRWSDSNLRRQLADHGLPSFKVLKKAVMQTVRKTPP